MTFSSVISSDESSRVRRVEPVPQTSLLRRLGPAILRRLRWILTRCRFWGVSLGSGCDVRARVSLRSIGPRAVIEIGRKCILDRDLDVECMGVLSVGERTIFGHHCTIGVQESVTIGRDCLIAELVSIRDHDHCFDDLKVPIRDQGAVAAPVRIGDNVWLGSKVTVLKGVTIGDGAVVGANAVVTRDIPAGAVAVGIPARVIRMRYGVEGVDR